MKRVSFILALLLMATSAYAGTLVFDFKDKSQLAYWYMADPLRTSESYIEWSIENEELVAVSRDVLQGGSSHIMVSDDTSEECVNYEVSCRFKIQEILEPSTRNESNAVFLIHWSIQRGEATWLSFNTRGGSRGTIWDEVDLGYTRWKWEHQPFDLPLEKGTWYTVRMVAEDSHYRMFLDDQLIIDTKGKIFPAFKSGFAGFGTKNAIIHFDDFILTGEDIPDKLEPLTQEFCSRWSLVPLIDEVTEVLSTVSPGVKRSQTCGNPGTD